MHDQEQRVLGEVYSFILGRIAERSKQQSHIASLGGREPSRTGDAQAMKAVQLDSIGEHLLLPETEVS